MFSKNLSSKVNVLRGSVTAVGALAIISLSPAANSQNLFVYLNNHTVHQITPDGVDLGVWANTFTDGDAQYNMAFDSKGNLFLSHDGHLLNLNNPGSRIEEFTPDGVGHIIGASYISSPYGVAIDSADSVYATNLDSNKISKYSGGSLHPPTELFASPGSQLFGGIAIDANDNVFVGTYNSILKFTPLGVESVFASTGIQFSAGMNFDSHGNLFVVNRGNSTVMEFTTGGIGSVFANTGFSGGGIAIDGADNVFVEGGSNSIKKITSGGVVSTFVTPTGGSPLAMAFQRSSSVPEPGAIAFGAIGFATAGFMIRKRRRSRK